MIFPTETYAELQAAFDHFNEHLFKGRLPPVMFTLTKKRKANGYFHAEQFTHRDGDTSTHQIAMNPDTMDRELMSVMATLVHEMTHLEQQEFGKPSKGGHHNEEWAKMMDAVGLIPVPRHGRKVSTEIDPAGGFMAAFEELQIELPYFTRPLLPAEKKKDLSKVKHTCSACGTNAWAKLGANLMCGDCEETMHAAD